MDRASGFESQGKISQKYSEELESMYACYKKVVASLMKQGLSYEDAQDAAQDTYIEAISYLPTLRNKECITSWLFSIAKRVGYKYLSRNRRKRDYEESIEEYEVDRELALAISGDKEMDDALGVSEKEILYKNILKLEDKERKVIALYYICGYSYNEIADLLELNHSTVRSISRRSKEKLRRLMIEDELNNMM